MLIAMRLFTEIEYELGYYPVNPAAIAILLIL